MSLPPVSVGAHVEALLEGSFSRGLSGFADGGVAAFLGALGVFLKGARAIRYQSALEAEKS